MRTTGRTPNRSCRPAAPLTPILFSQWIGPARLDLTKSGLYCTSITRIPRIRLWILWISIEDTTSLPHDLLTR